MGLSRILSFLCLLLISCNAWSIGLEAQKYLKNLSSVAEDKKLSQIIQDLSDLSWMKDDRLWLEYFAANLAFEQGNTEVAESYFKKLSEQKGTLALQSLFKIYEIKQNEKKHSESEKILKRIGEHPQLSKVKKLNLKFHKARFEDSVRKKNNELSQKHLAQLHRKFRSQISSLEKAEQKLVLSQLLKSKEKICNDLVDFFVLFPESEIATTWVGFIPEQKFDETVFTCTVTIENKRQRVRRLLLLGLNSKAEKEIEYYQSKKEISPEDIAFLRADYLTREGDHSKALGVLTPFLGDEQKNISILNLSAVLNARLQKFSDSADIYQKIYDLHPRRKDKSQALFDKAFVYYQGGMYKEAFVNFDLVSKRFGNTAQALDATWYRGWMHFLKANYELAALEFVSLIKSKKYNEMTKVQYWLARSLYELKLIPQAQLIFSKIENQRHNIYNYYSNLSSQWQEAISGQSSYIYLNTLVLNTSKNFLNIEFLKEVNIPEQLKYSSIHSIILVEDDPSYFDLQEFLVSEESSELQDLNSLIAEKTSELNRIFESEFFTDQFSNKIQEIRGFLTIGLKELSIAQLKDLYYKVKPHEQKLTLLKTFEELGLYQDTARMSELYMIYTKQLNKPLWIKQAFPLAYRSTVKKESRQFGVNEVYVYSIMRAESFFDPLVESQAHARGLMQLMPFTAARVGKMIGLTIADPNQLFDPAINIKLGSAYLSRLLQQFDNNYILASAAYNAGPHRVQTWLSQFGYVDQDVFIEHIPFRETRGYVKKVVGFMDHYTRLSGQGVKLKTNLLGPLNIKESLRVPASREAWEDL